MSFTITIIMILMAAAASSVSGHFSDMRSYLDACADFDGFGGDRPCNSYSCLARTPVDLRQMGEIRCR